MFVVVLILGILLIYIAVKGQQKSAKLIFGLTGVFDIILGLYGIITGFIH